MILTIIIKSIINNIIVHKLWQMNSQSFQKNNTENRNFPKILVQLIASYASNGYFRILKTAG